MDDDRSLRLKWVKLMHPGSRLGMFIREDICYLSIRVPSNPCTRSSSKAIADGIMQKVIGIEMQARSSMQAKGIPEFGARTRRWSEKWQHGVPRKGIGEVISIEAVKNVAWDKTRVEGERHRGGR